MGFNKGRFIIVAVGLILFIVTIVAFLYFQCYRLPDWIVRHIFFGEISQVTITSIRDFLIEEHEIPPEVICYYKQWRKKTEYWPTSDTNIYQMITLNYEFSPSDLAGTWVLKDSTIISVSPEEIPHILHRRTYSFINFCAKPLLGIFPNIVMVIVKEGTTIGVVTSHKYFLKKTPIGWQKLTLKTIFATVQKVRVKRRN